MVSRGSWRKRRESKPHCASFFQDSDCVTRTDISLASRNHMAEAGIRKEDPSESQRTRKGEEQSSLMQSVCIGVERRARGKPEWAVRMGGRRDSSCPIWTGGRLHHHNSHCFLSIKTMPGTGSDVQHHYLISRQTFPYYRWEIKAWVWKGQDSNPSLSDTKPYVLATTVPDH